MIGFSYSATMFLGRLTLITFAALSLMGMTAHATDADAKTPWNLNDVSYLFPLSNSLLKADGHELLKREIYSQLNAPVISRDRTPEQTYDLLRVVGVRIDPCVTAIGQTNCDPQVRLVWQTVLKDEKGNLTTEDAAMHTFYRLTKDQMSSLIADLALLKKISSAFVDTAYAPLQIHPAFQTPLVGSLFAKTLKSIVLRYCGEKNLIQVTAIQLSTPDIWWQFYGIKLDRSEWNPMLIPRIESVDQNYFNYSKTGGMDTQIFPYNDDGDQITDALRVGSKATEANRLMFKAALTSARKFQNPKLVHTEGLDCVQCHLAGPTAYWMNQVLSELEKKGETDRFTYVNPNPKLYNLANHSDGDRGTKMLRAFGYIKNRPAINQRTINETAEVAQYLNRLQGVTK